MIALWAGATTGHDLPVSTTGTFMPKLNSSPVRFILSLLPVRALLCLKIGALALFLAGMATSGTRAACDPVVDGGGTLHCLPGPHDGQITYNFSVDAGTPVQTRSDFVLDVGSATTDTVIDGGLLAESYYSGSLSIHLRNLVIHDPDPLNVPCLGAYCMDVYRGQGAPVSYLMEMDGGLVDFAGNAASNRGMVLYNGAGFGDQATLRMTSGTIRIAASGTYGLYGWNYDGAATSIEMLGGVIDLHGVNSEGIKIEGDTSSGRGYSHILQGGGNIQVSGDGGVGIDLIGVYSPTGGFIAHQVEKTGGTILVKGQDTVGILAQSYSSETGVRVDHSGGSVMAIGARARGISTYAPGTAGTDATVEVTGGSVRGAGLDSYGIMLQLAATYDVHIGGSAIVSGGSGNGAGLEIQAAFPGHTGHVRIDGHATVGSDNGHAISMLDPSTGLPVDGSANIEIADQADIEGSIMLGNGDDTLTWLGGTISGPVDLGAGDDQLILAGVSVAGTPLLGGVGNDKIRIDGPAATHLDLTSASGFEILEKTGSGTAFLTGTAGFSGGIRLLDGKLSFNGSGAAIQATSGRLGGTGTFTSLDTQSGVTLAPGNSIGTLHVTGNATLGAGTRMEVEVNADGRADKLDAIGQMSIGGGSTLQVVPEAGSDGNGRSFGPQTSYAILHAGGGLTGQFNFILENYAFLDAHVTYTATDAILTLERNGFAFADIALTPNQRAVAAGLDARQWSGSPLYGVLVGLTDAQSRAAFDLLSGEIHADVETGLFEEAGLLASGLRAPARADGNGLWVSGEGLEGHQAADGNAGRLSWSMQGLALGADFAASDAWRFGISGVVSNGSYDLADRLSDAHDQTLQLGGYGRFSQGGLHLTFGGGLLTSRIDTRREAVIGTFSQPLAATYDAQGWQAFGEAGYDVDVAPDLSLEPYAAFDGMQLHRGSFAETGGTAALTALSDTETRLYGDAGLRLHWRTALGDTPVDLSTGLTWQRLLKGRAADGRFTMQGVPAFDIAGLEPRDDAVRLDLGLSEDLGAHGTLDLTYGGQFAAGYAAHHVKLGFRMDF